jgi:hypothetical protein
MRVTAVAGKAKSSKATMAGVKLNRAKANQLEKSAAMSEQS